MLDIEKIRHLNPYLAETAKLHCALPDNLGNYVLVVKDFSPPNGSDFASFALEIKGCSSDSASFENKCWMSVSSDRIEEINHNKPEYNEGYKKFDYGSIEFYPYSVNLSGFTKIPEISEIISRLHGHIRFD